MYLLFVGAQFALAAVFGAAIAEKAASIRQGSAAWHPVFVANPILRSHAHRLMAGSLGLDLVVVLALLLAPRAGAILAVAAICAYSAAALRVHVTGDSCSCFWRFGNSRTRRGLLVRNCWLIGLAALSSQSRIDEVSFPLALGAAVVLMSVVLLIPYMLERETTVGGATT
jgi:hypothetical protein